MQQKQLPMNTAGIKCSVCEELCDSVNEEGFCDECVEHFEAEEAMREDEWSHAMEEAEEEFE